ncbi:MAG: hypothetical protein Kapaf2KO_18260 [Candidatus Kapaibacteriales bacterium]
MDKVKHISEILDSAISFMEIDEDVLSGKLQLAWPELVGKSVSESVKLFRLKDGVVTLLTESSTWRYELFPRKDDLVRILNEYLESDAVKSIRIR